MNVFEWLAVIRDAALIVLAGWVVYFSRAQVSSLNATIKLLETENKRLSGLIAPAITEQLNRMSQFANEMTAAKQEADQRADELRKQAIDPSGPAGLMGQAFGLLEGSAAITNVVRELWSPAGVLSGVVVDNQQVLGRLIEKQQQLYVASQNALAGRVPEWINLRDSHRQ